MKLPALRAELGGRTYYVTTLTFQQVSEYVSRIDDELHKSATLNDMIQRSISNNYLSIKEYILNQSELFFNSLVLAVYDDYPDWSEIEVKYDNDSTYQLGLLNFPGQHKIFPVDGQHRVEGIKAAILADPKLKTQQIAAIFIGHKNDPAGMLKTRRLFTTLNRYAKPVSLDDIIALDEDDEVAIVTRYLLEEYDLFSGKRTVIAEQKGISSKNQDALTSIITLYQANKEIFKCFMLETYDKKLVGKSLATHLKFRPATEEIEAFQKYIVGFWNAFKTKQTVVIEFLQGEAKAKIRNSENGGNLLFRPIGFLPLINTALNIHLKTKETFPVIFAKMDKIELELNHKPWQYVLWNPLEKKMMTGSEVLTQLIITYLYNPKLLTPTERNKMLIGYAARISYEGKNFTGLLKDFK